MPISVISFIFSQSYDFPLLPYTINLPTVIAFLAYQSSSIFFLTCSIYLMDQGNYPSKKMGCSIHS